MSLRFNHFIVACLFLTSVFAQEKAVESDSIRKNNTLRFHFDFGTGIAPQAVGDNFIAEGYDLSRSIDLGMTFAYSFLTFHLDHIAYKGDVTDQTVTGNYVDSRFRRSSFGLGYPWQLSDKLLINPSLNYGYLDIKSELRDTTEELEDDGQFVMISILATYEITDWFSFYVNVSAHRDFLNIETPAEIQDSFDRSVLIVPSIGIRLSSRKKARKKGEPGDGIFTRRDGL